MLNANESQADKRFAERILREYRRSAQARAEHEPRWELSRLFYRGKQFQGWQAGEVRELASLRKRARGMTLNVMLPQLEVIIGKLLSSLPVWRVIGAGNEPQDTEAARAAEAVLSHIWRESEVNAKYFEFVHYLVWTGNAFLFPHFAGMTGPVIAKDDRGEIREGTVKLDVLPPTAVYPDADAVAPDLSDCRFATRRVGLPLSNVLSRWPEAEGALGGHDEGDRVTLLEYFSRGESGAPGKHAVLTEDGYLLEAADGYEHGELPFARAVYHWSGDFWGFGPAENARAIQRQINYFYWKLARSVDFAADPSLLAPAGSIDPAQVTNEPGKVLSYNPAAGKPEMLSTSGVGGDVTALIELLTRVMETTTLVPSFERGQTPQNANTATAWTMLDANARVPFNPKLVGVENCFARAGRQLLVLAKEFWPEGKLVKTVGANFDLQVRMFLKSDLERVHDVAVSAGSNLPMSKAAFVAAMPALLDLVVDKDNPRQMKQFREQYARLVGFNFTDEAELADTDRSTALLENENMLSGKAVQVSELENHEVHVEQHLRVIRTMKFKTRLNERARALFLEHFGEHLGYLASAGKEGS